MYVFSRETHVRYSVEKRGARGKQLILPDCVPIGGDGMSEYVALDFATKPARVVAIDATDEDPEASLYPVAATFEEFVALIGREPEEG